MYCYVFTAMVLAHPCAAGVRLAEEDAEQKPPKRKPPRRGKTMRVKGPALRAGREQAAVAAAG